MATPAQATNGNNKYYKDAQSNVFEAGTNRSIQLPEFQQLGLNIDHLNPQVDTSQPDPATVQAGLQKVQTPGVGPDGKPIYDVFAGQEHVQDPNDPRLKGVDIAGLQSGQAPTGFKSKFEQGFQNATNAGVSNLDSPGQGMSTVQQYAPSQKNDLASTFLKADPYIDGLVKNFQAYIDPKNQRASLSDTYSQMMKDSGIQALDMELINTKNVIEGSEDDLRNEITKAGGFATESQVMALTNARNKQLIKNYNTLLDTRNSKEKYLETMIGLETQDRQAADQRFESMFNMGTQIVEMQQKMQQNAQQQFQWLQQTTGFDGLYDATGGDPYYTNLVEQSLGLPPGGLLTSANQARLAKMQAEEERQLELQTQQAQLETAKMQPSVIKSQLQTDALQRANISSQISSRKASDQLEQQKFQQGQQQVIAKPQQLAQQKGQIDQVNGLFSDKYLTSAVGPNPLARFSVTNLVTGGKSNFVAGVEQLRSQLNIKSLIDAKSSGATFGALSDQELQLLSNSATKLGSWAIKDKNGSVTGYKTSESSFKAELDKINNFAKMDYLLKGGDPTDVGAIQLPDGSYATKNSDGSITKF